MSSLLLISASSDLPVSVCGFKQHLKFSGSGADDNLELLLTAATTEAELFTGRTFMPAIWELALPDFQNTEIPKAPVTGINSVYYFDSSGNTVELASGTDYYADIAAEPAKLYFENSFTTFDKVANPVRLNFGTGYTDVPKDIQAAILFAATDFYTNPTDTVRNMPTKGKSLLRNYRIYPNP